MQSNHFENIHGISSPDPSNTDLKSEADSFSTKKRRRTTDSKSWSKKEEDKILQYALKLSQKEFKREQSRVKLDSYEEIPESATFIAKKEDFHNFIDYVEKCWKSKECSGVMKIIPASTWANETKEIYDKEIFPKVEQDERKLMTRVQNLNELYKAKVIKKLI
jgi:hypothetical protein